MFVSRNSMIALVACLVLGPLAVAGRAEAEAPCTGRPLIQAGDAFRGESVEPRRAHRLLLRVTEPGLLAVAAAAPGREPLAPELALDPAPCGPPGASAVILERRADALLAAIRTPGVYRLRVVPRDPLLALGPYRVESRFGTAPWVADAGVASISAADGTGGGSPQPNEEEEEIEEVDGRPVNSPLSTEPGEAPGPGGLAALCGAGADDHADLPQCASSLEPGKAVAGTLENEFSDDHDLFSFRLVMPARVEIASGGASDTLGGLYDARGRRLSLDDDGGEDHNFLLRHLLRPGRYFVRVEGAGGAEGPYRITLRTSQP